MEYEKIGGMPLPYPCMAYVQYLTISSEIEKDADSTFDNWWKGYFISSMEDDKLQKYLIQLKLFMLNMSWCTRNVCFDAF